MKRFLSILAAVAFTGLLIAPTEVQAQKNPARTKPAPAKVKPSTNHKAPHNVHHNGHQVNHTHTSHHNVRFHGRGYAKWSAFCWFNGFRCYGFYDPTCQGWFYWHDGRGQFLPTDSLAANAPPTSGAALLPTGAVPVSATPVTPAQGTGAPPLVMPPPLIETPPLVVTPLPVETPMPMLPAAPIDPAPPIDSAPPIIP